MQVSGSESLWGRSSQKDLLFIENKRIGIKSEQVLKKLTQSSWGIIFISIFVTLSVSIDFWRFIATGYEGDSFYTLGLLEGVGLSAITIILSFGILFIGFKKSYFLYEKARQHNTKPEIIFLLDVLLSLFIFGFFVWLSPQVYYAYYYVIFDGLPAQIVIKNFPDIRTLIKIVTLSDHANLSFHGQGLLARALIIQTFIFYFITATDRGPR
ncbi:hypothetical protein [Kiloniella spongiae]|uniref:hypothetical protein n=1 Tax=Kiloniella spongiae TaxID=1489064 RepID=UPI0012DFF9EE|nr:hypothetical protein [Kiloniella spongiae]